ncbi:MAG TPA: OsmC family protein [Flavobacterium sp.]|nr:OsmC family protein [Flavobacterium sp.]
MSVEQISLLSFTNQSQLNIKSSEIQLTINQNDLKKNSNAHLEYLLAGFAACINVVGHQIANDLGMDLKSIQIEITGKINTNQTGSNQSKDRSGFESIDLTIKPVTNADLTTLKFWMDEIKERCPIYDNLLNATPINLVVTKDYRVKAA